MTGTSQRDAGPAQLKAWHREAQQALGKRDFQRTHELCTRILQREQSHAGALFLLGLVAVEHGNFGKGAEVIQRAIALDDLHADYHAQLARCLTAIQRPQEAAAAAQRALALQPKDAWTFDTIGVVLTRLGRYADAVAPFERAIALDSDRASYHYNYGAALQFIGNFALAQKEYRRAVELEPDLARAWSSLAQVAKNPFTASDVTQIESLLAAAPTVDAQLQLCHALAKHHEDAGDYARSFHFLERGKARKRVAIDYSIATDQALFDTVRRVCTPEFIDAGGGSSSREPIFIVGMPRTGTTLVERILSSHPDVFSAGELTHFALRIKQAARTQSNLVLDVPTLQAASSLDWRGIGESYVASTRPRTGHTAHFIDKMPLNFFYAGFIARALPNAKIICLRRNPLDACLSNYRQLFATQFPYYNYAYDLLNTGRYYCLFDALAAHWRTLLKARFLEVRYEDVVADTESEARRLVEFCGLNWDSACLNFHENAAPVATASSVQVRQPIYNTSIARWRRYGEVLQPLQALLRANGVALD